ncbi:MAG: OsmC family peroxiredoxin [Dehalococcoidia bacterium]|nr:MAG: OsmC family peroxiredoxin [Dehalococcoidia bacterium]
MTTATVVNGLSTRGVQDMVEMVKARPAVAQATFSASTEWKGGFGNEARVRAFTLGGARNEASRSQPFVIAGDHPAELLGTNQGPMSVELLLAALGHCLSSGWATYGAVMGVSIDALRVEVEGDVDLQGMLALPEPGAVPPGYSAIRATYHVRSGAPRDQLEQVAKMAEDLSPTRHSLRAVEFSSRLEIER